jgi:cytoskeletal protein CcmA (bactofilin family)
VNLVTDRSQAPARYQEQDRLLRREGGYVLIWSLFAFVLLGALAAAVLKSTGSERRLAKASSEWNASFYAAEVGLQQAMGLATDSLLAPLQTGDSVDLGWRPIDGATAYRAVIYRIDDGPHLLYQIRSTGRHDKLFGGQTTVTRNVTTSSDIPTGLVFNQGLTVSGNAKILGGCRVHANNFLNVPGSLVTDGPVSSDGLVDGNITTEVGGSPTIESYGDPQSPDPIDMNAACSSPDYMVRNGWMHRRARGDSLYMGHAAINNWSMSNVSGVDTYTVDYSSSVADDGIAGMRAQGTFCVDGSFKLTYSPGTAGSPEPLSVFATGFVELVGNPFVEAADPSGTLFEALGDVLLTGIGDPTGPNFVGKIRSRAQCDVGGSARVDGALECFGEMDPPNVQNLVPDNVINGDLELVTPCNLFSVVTARPVTLRSWRHDY